MIGDVRTLRQVGDLTQFQNFLRALAARSAQLLYLTDLARDLESNATAEAAALVCSHGDRLAARRGGHPTDHTVAAIAHVDVALVVGVAPNEVGGLRLEGHGTTVARDRRSRAAPVGVDSIGRDAAAADR